MVARAPDDLHRPLVLLVDDVPDIRAAYRFLLEHHEFRVLEAEDADAALALLVKHQFDVVLTDLYMPGRIDGVRLIETIRKRPGRRLGIIAMSGTPHLAYRSSLQAARYVGADAALTKPIPGDVLVTTIRRLTGGGPSLTTR
jgi:CheY-like chemotaxis protein